MQIEMKIKNPLAIEIQGYSVRMMQTELGEYICVTDIEKTGKYSIFKNYLRNWSNWKFLALWEHHFNSDFKTVDSDCFRDLLSSNSIAPSLKVWLKRTDAIGFISTAGRHGCIYAHYDIAIHMTAYFSSETYFHLTKELQRLKEAEQNLLNNPTKIPLEEIIAEANRMRDAKRDKSKIIGEEEE